MRAIDADALEELFREVIGGIAKKPEMNGNLEHMVRASAMVIEMIQDAPTIEPQRKKGHWIRHPEQRNIFNGKTIECSECHEKYTVQYVEDELFCRHCGADMREDAEDIPMEYFESGGR